MKTGTGKQGGTPLGGDVPVLCSRAVWGESGGRGLFAEESSREKGGCDAHHGTSQGLFETRR